MAICITPKPDHPIDKSRLKLKVKTQKIINVMHNDLDHFINLMLDIPKESQFCLEDHLREGRDAKYNFMAKKEYDRDITMKIQNWIFAKYPVNNKPTVREMIKYLADSKRIMHGMYIVRVTG